MAFRKGRFAPLFSRISDDRYVVNLTEGQRELMDSLLGQLRDMLDGQSPALKRLFPEPYGDDSERNAGYAVLAGAELIENRTRAIDAVRASLATEELSEEELNQWMRTVNDLRLVLGTILDVSDDENPEPEDESALEMFHVYEHLGFILEHIVRALGDW